MLLLHCIRDKFNCPLILLNKVKSNQTYKLLHGYTNVDYRIFFQKHDDHPDCTDHNTRGHDWNLFKPQSKKGLQCRVHFIIAGIELDMGSHRRSASSLYPLACKCKCNCSPGNFFFSIFSYFSKI